MPGSNNNSGTEGNGESPLVTSPQGMKPFRRKPTHGIGVHVQVEVFEPNDLGPHQHAEWQVLIVPHGAAHDAVWHLPGERRQKRRLVGGDVWLIPPGCIHSSRWRESCELIVLYVDDAKIRRYCPQIARHRASVAKLTEYAAAVPGIVDLCREVRGFSKSPNGPTDWRLAAAGSHLATSLLHAHLLLTDGVFRPPSALVATIVEKLDRHLAENRNDRLRLGVVSQSLGVSDRNLRRIFRSTMGVSPQEWIMVRKAETAVRSLLDGKSVKETVEFAGFASESHLHRVVLRIYGVSPTAFRKHRQTSVGPLRA
jgi:AraC-like DNA-binding protein